jgi:TPR repeat protein
LTALLSAGESWRVAALTMMGPEALAAALSGEHASAWVEAAAACGIAEAQIRLGRMKLEGDAKAAYELFRDAAAQGHADAHNMLGRCHENGWGTDIDYPAAAREYATAADAGLGWAQYNLGHMLLSGVGVPRDRAAAFHLYSKAAAQGHVRAMSLVGRCHEEGWGTARNPRAALLWYRRAARGGYFRGAFNYASLLRERNFPKSAELWLTRALAWAPEASRANMRVSWKNGSIGQEKCGGGMIDTTTPRFSVRPCDL